MLLGGGEQSRRETLRALSMGKPVTVIRGFGGAADALTIGREGRVIELGGPDGIESPESGHSS